MTINEDKLTELSELAYADCVRWYGPPTDFDNKYDIFFAPYSACVYSGLMRRYLIQIQSSDVPVEIMRSVGHEIYHRVTSKRVGLHKQVWASEMLAFLSEQWFLEERSLGRQAQSLEETLFAFEDRVPIIQVRQAVRKTGLISKLRRDFYPPNFSQHIARLACALCAIVGRDGMTRMVGAHDLTSWIDALPISRRAPVRRILQEPDLSLLPADAASLRRYAYACLIIGDIPKAIWNYRQALFRHPDDAEAKEGLAFALERAATLSI